MKKLVIMIAVVLFALPVSSFAGGTGDLNVSATVVAGCRFDTGGTLDFGNLFSGDSANVTLSASSQPTFFCTNLTAYTITNNDGLNSIAAGVPRLFDGGASYMEYSIAYTATGTGDGNVNPMDLTGTINAAQYTAAAAGAYTDTIVLTIAP